MDIKTLNRISKLGGPKTIEDIKKICDFLNIIRYTINKDLTVDVRGGVNLYHLGLERIPLKFGKVDGVFHCSYNQLTSLEGAPIKVNGSFSCILNKITSLEGCPKKVNGDFYCSNNKVEFTEEEIKKVCKVRGKIYN